MPIDPSTLAGKVLWLRAKDQAGADSTAITAWADQSGTSHDPTVVAATKPPLIRTGQTPAGGRAVEFRATSQSGVADSSAGNLDLPDLGLATAGEAWIVVKSTSTRQGLWNLGASTGEALYRWSDGKVYENFGIAGARVSFTPTLEPVNNWRLYRVVNNGGAFQAWLDNVSQLAASTGTVGWAGANGRIGAGGGGGAAYRFQGFVAEVLVRDRVSTSGEVADLITYFNTEHGLSVPGGSTGSPSTGAGVGTYAFTGTGVGKRSPGGFGVGAFQWAGVGTGTSSRRGSGAGTFLWAGAAVGNAPSLGIPEGDGVGSFQWAGVAAGSANRSGSGLGTYGWAGAGVGTATTGVPQGVGVGTFGWVGEAAGDDGVLRGSFGWVGSVTVTPVIGYVEHPPAVAPDAIFEHTLMRQSHQMPAPVKDAHGRYRSTGAYTIIEEPVGVLHAWVDGVDVTYLRDVPVGFGTMRSSLPGADETASLEFPQVHPFDERGVGDLAPLREDAPCEVAIMRPDGSRIHMFAGHLVSDNVNQGPRSNDETWHVEGTLMQADHVGHAVPVSLPLTDIGSLVPDALNSVVSRRYPRIPRVTTGQKSQKRGAYNDSELDYVTDLLSTAWQVDERQWTIARTGTPRKFSMQLKDRTTVHHVLTAAAPGVTCNLTEDHAERVDVIYGRGVAPDGYSWAGWHFPGFHDYDPPDYPYASASTMMTVGSSGAGVNLARTRLRELRYTLAPSGAFDSTMRAVVKAFQGARGIKVDGVVGPQTWNELWNLGTHNLQAPIRLPLAWRTEVAPVLYDDSGVAVAPNPTYDTSIIRHELDIDFGSGVTKAEATASAQQQLARDVDPGWAGTITLETCPWYTSRWEIFEGQNIKLLGWRGQDILLHVAEVTKDPTGGTVTVTVDTKARDAMTLSSVLVRDRESRPDPARRPGNVNRRSRQQQDMAVEFDGESPAGKLHRIPLMAGLWTVWTMPLSQVGTLAKVELATDSPATEFYAGLFGAPITSNTLKSLVGNPAGDEAWTRNEDVLADRYGYISSWGNSSEAAGHWPNEGDGPVTGKMLDTGSLEFISARPPWVWVALYSPVSTFIQGRFRPGPVT